MSPPRIFFWVQPDDLQLLHTIRFVKLHVDERSTTSQMVQGVYQTPPRWPLTTGIRLISPNTAIFRSSEPLYGVIHKPKLLFDHKSCDSLEKWTFCLRNEFQYTTSTILMTEPDTFSMTPVHPETRNCSRLSHPSVEDDTASSKPSTPRTSLANSLGPIIDPLRFPAMVSFETPFSLCRGWGRNFSAFYVTCSPGKYSTLGLTTNISWS